jgi:1,4-dihydroxy-2-naphthoyl-CoA hydrolase
VTTQDGKLGRPAGLDQMSEGLHKRMGIEFLEVGAQRTVGRMPVEGNTQPYGLLHGGASCVLAESLGSLGAAAHAFQLNGGYAVGVEISATHHRAISSGDVTGVARPLHTGRSVATYEITITDDEDRRVCTARLTCMLREPARSGSE